MIRATTSSSKFNRSAARTNCLILLPITKKGPHQQVAVPSLSFWRRILSRGHGGLCFSGAITPHLLDALDFLDYLDCLEVLDQLDLLDQLDQRASLESQDPPGFWPEAPPPSQLIKHLESISLALQPFYGAREGIEDFVEAFDGVVEGDDAAGAG